MKTPSPKKLLEQSLGRKLTKEEFEIEKQKLFDKWNEALGDLEDDEPLSPEDLVALIDEDDIHGRGY